MNVKMTQSGLVAVTGDNFETFDRTYKPKRQAWLKGKFVDYDFSSESNLKYAKQFHNNMDHVGTGSIHYLDGVQQPKEHLHFFAFKKKKK